MASKLGSASVIEVANRANSIITADGITGVANNLANHQSGLNNNAHQIANIAGLQSLLDSKADKGVVTQTLTVITEVDFINQTVVTANINIVDGIIVEID